MALFSLNVDFDDTTKPVGASLLAIADFQPTEMLK
jgi:hypothetical protein